MMTEINNNIFSKYRHIAPLAVFRIAFGAVLFISTIRFILHGWISDFYILPKYHFPFYGFAWVYPLPATGMYILYASMATAALGICTGLYYRIASIVFLACFFYAEVLDKTYYLNHYYLVTLCTFLLVLVPANRYWSLDVWRKPGLRATHIPYWTIAIIRIQLCIIYFCAGLSKLTTDWLIHAQPLKIWLLAKSSVPVLGPFFKHEWVAYLFSWGGAVFDLSIPFLLTNRKTRTWGYLFVVIFHALTAILFQIGMFPWLMITATLIFFPAGFYLKIADRIKKLFSTAEAISATNVFFPLKKINQQILLTLLSVYFLFQLLVPFRFLLYPGKLLWTEEGYRFSWRVMLMEKSGASFFYVKNPATGRKFEVNNAEFLTAYQERMMETQPDMMVQYAKILKTYYRKNGIADPVVNAEAYVSLNGSGSQLYIDSTIDLATQKETLFGHQQWILPFKQ